ncbi:MAG: hypothetical protein QOE45_450 [Frankiaceae bacterium]|jgi:hypothetical protein|nr:hypothetical protein [Frankiaceae bacterium]
MRRASLLAMLLLLCGLVVPASHAASGEGILLRGSKTAYVDLYVYVNTTIDAASLRLSGRGSYVGFFMSPAPANRDTVGALVMPRVGAVAADPIRLGQSWEVQAGKYRVFLLTNGPAEVFVPITGQGYRGYTPRGTAPLSVRTADFDAAPLSAGASRKTTVQLRSRSLVVAAGRATTKSLASVDRVTACVTAATACSTTYAATARLPSVTPWSYGAELVPPGTYTGVLDLTRVGGADAATHVAGSVVILTIGIQT